MMVAMGAFYDPDPNAPLGIRLPVDLRTCVVDQDRWSEWLKNDPVVMIDRVDVQENLKSLKGIYIDCGFKDQYNLHFGARQLSDKLIALGIEHTHEEFDDNHSSVDYRMDISFPFMYKSLTE
jgi:S-formylglutathione hydrolase FrmB